ncbi:MAG: hypothetical protein V3W04_14165 [Gammaproteobacteria bacterium]
MTIFPARTVLKKTMDESRHFWQRVNNRLARENISISLSPDGNSLIAYLGVFADCSGRHFLIV